MSNIVYLNGELIPVSQAKISVMDYGFLYGYGLFETMRAYSGKVFRMDDHLERLSLSAEIIGKLIGRLSQDELVEVIEGLNEIIN